jgi:hypothetical protein
MLRGSFIANTLVTLEGMDRAEAVFGIDEGLLKGKVSCSHPDDPVATFSIPDILPCILEH